LWNQRWQPVNAKVACTFKPAETSVARRDGRSVGPESLMDV
jgi:hypothetical protein